MFRSVFTKLLVTFFAIILVTLAVQSFLLGFIYQDYLHTRQTDDMVTYTQNLAQSASMVHPTTLDQDFLESVREDANFKAVLNNAARQYDCIIWLTDGNNRVLQVDSAETDEDARSRESQSITLGAEGKALFARLELGETVVTEGTLDGMFETDHMTVGVPIFRDKIVIGAVITHVETESLIPVYTIVNMTAIRVGCVACVIGFILIYFIARRIVLPLRKMREASEKVAKNEFEGPIPVTSNDEVGDLVVAFNSMADQLKRQEQLRSGFIANVSHELRSPITSMQGFAQGMLDGTIPQEEHPKYLGIINDESRRLTKLIKELLDLSRAESGNFPLHISRFDLNELIRRVMIRYLDRMEDKGIEPDPEFAQEYLYVQADADRIEQVIVNLVDNAIKFTEAGGTIGVKTMLMDKKAVFIVSDTGIGIPEEDVPYVFERFYKVDKSHTDKKGTGLGLAISKKIMDQHNARFMVHSQLGKGTSFTGELEASANQQPEHPTPEALPEGQM